jgi:outer membrane protein
MIAKLSLAINVLLIVAVIILFSRTSGSQPAGHAATPATPSAFSDTSAARAPVVAYINGDSINEKYAFITEKSASLEAGLKKANSKVQAEYGKRQKEAEELMQYAQGKQLPDDEKSVIQQRLMQLEEEMAMIEEREKESLMKQEVQLQKDLQERVNAFLQAYVREKGIDYVLNYQEGVQVILYGNEAYDVTSDVLKGLNDAYREEKSGK